MDDPQRDPVIFGPDGVPPGHPPVEDDDLRPTHRARWPGITVIMIVVALMVAALGIWVF